MKKGDLKKNDKQLLHRALDGETNKSETKRLEEKLQADGKMRSEYELLKKVMKDTTRIRIEVPEDFTQKVLDETRRIKKQK